MSKQKYPQATAVSTLTGVPRKGREFYSQVRAHARQDRKRHEAYARQDKYDRLTLTEQLNSCVPGGSKRQRIRIEAEMARAVAVPVKVTVPAKVVGEKKTRTPKSKVIAAAKAERPAKS